MLGHTAPACLLKHVALDLTACVLQEDYGGDVQASNAELLVLQIKRYKLEKWVREPFFDKTVIGCLVKVAYNGKYHVAEVVDVQERDPGRTRYHADP